MRPLRVDDLSLAATLLADAFRDYEEAADWAEEHLLTWWRWRWDGGLSIIETDAAGAVALACADWRAARFEDEPLRVVHIGPLAVRSDRWGRGLGRQLLKRLETDARRNGADLLTLTTESRQSAHHLYRKVGFRVVESFEPVTAVLDGRTIARAQGFGWLGFVGAWFETRAKRAKDVTEIRGADLLPFTCGLPRRGSIVEAELPVYPDAVGFMYGDAIVAVASFPVVAGPRRTRFDVAQILGAHGPRGDRIRALDAALHHARETGAAAAFGLPAAGVLPGMRAMGPQVLRMAKGLSDAGEHAVSRATAWDERAPSS